MFTAKVKNAQYLLTILFDDPTMFSNNKYISLNV